MGMYLMDVHLIGVYLMNIHLTGVYLIGVHLTGMYLISVYYGVVPIVRRKGAVCLRIGIRYMGILIFENSFVLLEIFGLRFWHWQI